MVGRGGVWEGVYYRSVGRNLRERRQSSCPTGKWHSFEPLGSGFSRRLDRGWDVGHGGELLSPVGPAPSVLLLPVSFGISLRIDSRQTCLCRGRENEKPDFASGIPGQNQRHFGLNTLGISGLW